MTGRASRLAAVLAALLLAFPATAPAVGRVDLNRATVAELSALPGLAAPLPERIVAYREAHGGFKTVFDLMKVEGVTGEVFQPLVDRLSAEPAGASESSPTPAPAAADRPGVDLGAPLAEGRLRAPARAGAETGAGRIGRAEVTPESVFKAGFGLARRGKFDMAEKMFAQFIEASPGHKYFEDARYLRAACLEEMERYPIAIEEYRKVYDSPASAYRAIALFRVGVCQDLAEDYPAALATYEKFLAEFPDSQWKSAVESRLAQMKE